MTLNHLSPVVCRSRHILKDSLHPVHVFMLETHNQTNYKRLPKFIKIMHHSYMNAEDLLSIWIDTASSGTKMAKVTHSDFSPQIKLK